MGGQNYSENAIHGDFCMLIREHISRLEYKETQYCGKRKRSLKMGLKFLKMNEIFQVKHGKLKNEVKLFGASQVYLCKECINFKAR